MSINVKKSIPIFIFLLIALILLPQTFASDIANDTVGVGDETEANAIASDIEADAYETYENENLGDESSVIYVSTDGNDNNDGSKEKPVATISKAIDKAENLGICDIYINNGTYTDCGIEITSTVNIIGLGNVIVDAEENDRIFKIEGEYEVTLSNLILMNGVAPKDKYSADIHEVVWYASGGAVFINEAYVKMDNITFINNYADDFGGAINAEGPNCEIANCKFVENVAGVFGGAIDFENANCSVVNCTFISNDATNGGAIGWIGDNAILLNSYFENNTAEDGGAVFIENTLDSQGNLIQNNKFIRNSASQQGGAIEVENENMYSTSIYTKIFNNEFKDNYAFNGGAISAYYGDTASINNTFISNSAGYGGAIASISTTAYLQTVGKLYLRNNTIINCSAEENGNGIFTMGKIYSKLNITFMEGKTIDIPDGKAIDLNVTVCDDMGNPISGTGIEFTVAGKKTLNPASDLIEGLGTVHFVPRENGTFEVSGIINSGVYDGPEKPNLVTGTIIVDNAISDYFGTVYVSGDNGDDDNNGSAESPVKTFTQAYRIAAREGGSYSILLTKGTYEIEGFSVTHSLNVTGVGNPILDGKNKRTLFDLYGSETDEFHFTGLTFTNGVATPSTDGISSRGGAIFIKGGTLYLENDTFTRNSASDDGGALYVNKGLNMNYGIMYTAYAYINNCIFHNNYAKTSGGAIGVYESVITITNTTFTSNSAKKGGAISTAMGAGNLTIENSIFEKNTASDIGGALDIENFKGTNTGYASNIINSTFISNTANYAGAIIFGNGNITSCIFEKNTANLQGGAILINQSFLGTPITDVGNVKYCIFKENTAQEGNVYYGTSTLIDDNFWATNYKSIDDLIKNNNVVFTGKNATPSLINVVITGKKEVLVGKYEYNVEFVSTSGNELNSALPDFNVKISNSNSKNQLNESDLIISNNKAVFTFTANDIGNDIVSIYDGNTAITSQNIVVYTKKNLEIIAENVSYPADSTDKIIEIALKDEGNSLSNKSLQVKVNNETYNITTDANGNANIEINLTEVNCYNVEIAFEGDDYYNPANRTVTVDVYEKSNVIVTSENAKYSLDSNNKLVTATLKDVNGTLLVNKTVIFKIDGKNYTAHTDNAGTATVCVELFKVGIFDVEIEFAGDNYYHGANEKSILNITSIATKLTVPNKSFVVTASTKNLVILLTDSKGNVLSNKLVTFTINGKQYNRTTNFDGQATLKVNQKVGTYKVTVKFAGNDAYQSCSKTATLKITKEKTKMSVPNKTFKKSQKTKKVTVTLKTNSGKALAKKKITLKVNGKTFKGTTNSKGKATITVKLTAKKTYKATVKFAGDSKFASITKKSTIKIK